MLTQLTRFMALFVLCGLLLRPAMAGAEGSQTLTSDSDSLVVPVLAEPLPANAPTLAARNEAQGVQEDSLRIKEDAPPFDIENVDLRMATKVVTGTLSGMVFTTMSVGVLDKIEERENHPDKAAWRPFALYFLEQLSAVVPSSRWASPWSILMILRSRPYSQVLYREWPAIPYYPSKLRTMDQCFY